jgi:hypothetical protein
MKKAIYAFPAPASALSLGMTLRDYFACQALVGILSNYTTQKFGFLPAEVSQAAFQYADAMIAAREGES